MTKRLIVLLTVAFCSVHFSLFGSETIRILAIGNSFSEDAVENYLHELGKADDITLIVGNMYIGGCSLETHWNNAKNDSKAYSYRKIDASGIKKTTANVSISQAIADEEWDYISLQQVSQNSGMYDTHFPYLTDLLNYVKGKATNESVKYIWHMTWAYAKNSTHGGFVNYDKDQMKMYEAIVTTATSLAKVSDIDAIVPSGTAIQNARTSLIGDNLCRDGYHLDYNVGRYIAACTWYEKLTGKDVIGNKYKPSSVSSLFGEIAQKAAHYAVLEPTAVTDMSDMGALPDPEFYELTSSVNIDFGNSGTITATPWNNMTSYSKGASIHGLLDMKGELTPFKIEIVDPFGGVNTNGPSSGLNFTGWSLPKEATSDSFFGNAGDAFNGNKNEKGSFLISGLNPNRTYSFSFLASRYSANDNRETYFLLEGVNSEKVLVNSANNGANLAIVNEIQPKSDGTIKLTVGAGENNNNSYKFFYINSLQIMQKSASSLFSSFENDKKDVRLCSNLATDVLQVLGLEKNSKYEYVICQVDGVIVKKGTLYDSSDYIDVSSLYSSYYMLILKDSAFSSTKQLSFLKKGH